MVSLPLQLIGTRLAGSFQSLSGSIRRAFAYFDALHGAKSGSGQVASGTQGPELALVISRKSAFGI